MIIDKSDNTLIEDCSPVGFLDQFLFVYDHESEVTIGLNKDVVETVILESEFEVNQFRQVWRDGWNANV